MTRTLTAAFCVIVQRWKQPRCPSPEEWINKVWPSHSIDCHSAIKRNDALAHATTWVGVEEVMLSEGSRPQKATYYRVPCTGNILSRSTHRDGKQVGGWEGAMESDG